jgi:hypothetical protein
LQLEQKSNENVNKIPGFQPKVIFFLKNSIFKRN